MEILELDALSLGAAIRARKLGVREVTECYLNEIEARDGAYHCYNTVCRASALARADEVQKGLDDGTYTGPLAGVPVGVKDNICTKGIPTTCSSKILSGFLPTYNATVVERLKDAGMVLLGKLNMDEFAMGSTTETSFTGPTRNPWDTSRVPGGSSGGSAAAVAARLAPIALGSDTGGSIRQPASFCGVSGLKPTYGAVSRYGLVAYASSLDQIGPIGRTAADCAALFSVIQGKDSRDGTSMETPALELAGVLEGTLQGKRVGLPADYFGDGLSADVRAAVEAAAETCRSLGATVETFSLPIVKYAVPAYYIIACAEACSNLSRYDGIKYGYRAEQAEGLLDVYVRSRAEGFGMEVKRRIMLGNFVLSAGYYDAYYNKALKAKKLIQQSFFDAFERFDLLLGPVSPATAPKLGESLSDPLKMYLDDIYTVMINIAGVPSMALPCGFGENGMPVGMQLIGKPFCEAEILSAAAAFQRVTGFHRQFPQSV